MPAQPRPVELRVEFRSEPEAAAGTVAGVGNTVVIVSISFPGDVIQCMSCLLFQCLVLVFSSIESMRFAGQAHSRAGKQFATNSST